MRSFKSLSAIVKNATTRIPVAVSVDGSTHYITAPVAGCPTSLNDVAKIDKFLATKGKDTMLACVVSGSVASGVNRKGKATFPVVSGEISAADLSACVKDSTAAGAEAQGETEAPVNRLQGVGANGDK